MKDTCSFQNKQNLLFIYIPDNFTVTFGIYCQVPVVIYPFYDARAVITDTKHGFVMSRKRSKIRIDF
jgi:hypothetical protein